MSKFVRTYRVVDDKVQFVEAELEGGDLEIFLKFYPDEMVYDEPTGGLPVLYLENSIHLKREPIDFGDNPVVINL